MSHVLHLGTVADRRDDFTGPPGGVGGDRTIDVREGQLAAIDRSLTHEIEAVEESAFVLHVSGND